MNPTPQQEKAKEQVDRFSYDTNGYNEAVKYLKELGQWEYIRTHGFSTDGWSVISEANSIYKKRKEIN